MNLEKIVKASEYMKKASDLLLEVVEEETKPKIKITIENGNKGPFEDMDELIEKFNKDLEEMLNDNKK